MPRGGSKGTDIKTYTTNRAREDWKTMLIEDFLAKYHVSHANACSALGKRTRLLSEREKKNKEKVDRIGKENILFLVEEYGEMPVARLIGLNQASFRNHIMGKKRAVPSVKKWKQPNSVGLI